MSINLFCPRTRRVDSLSRPPGFGHIFRDPLEKSSLHLRCKCHRLAAALLTPRFLMSPPDCHSFTQRRHATFSKEGFKLARHPFKLFRTAKNTHTFRHACFCYLSITSSAILTSSSDESLPSICKSWKCNPPFTHVTVLIS